MNDLNTQQLVERAKNGDKAAFDELYRTYSEPLLKFVMKQGLNEFDAQDVVSETFMKAMNSIGQIQDTSKFSTWLHTIAKRTAGEYKEKAGRYQRVELNSGDSDHSDANGGDSAAVDIAFQEAYGDTVMLPADYAENEDIKKIIAEQINSLSPAQRETLFLFYYKNKSVAEISELTGSSQSSVKANLSYARSNLKKKLEELKSKGIVLCAVPFTNFIPHFSDMFENTAAASSAAGSSSAGQAAAGVGSQASAAVTTGISGLKIAVIAVAAAAAIGAGTFALMSINKGSDDKTSSIVSVETSRSETTVTTVTTSVQTTTSAVSSQTTSSKTESSEPSEDPHAAELSACKIKYIEMLKKLVPDNAGDIGYIIEDLDGDVIPEIIVSYGYELNPDFGKEYDNPMARFQFKYLKSDTIIMTIKDGAFIHGNSYASIGEMKFLRPHDNAGKNNWLILTEHFSGYAARDYQSYKLEGKTIKCEDILRQDYDSLIYSAPKIECKIIDADSKERLINAVETYFQAKN